MKFAIAAMAVPLLLSGCTNAEPDWDLAVKPSFAFHTLTPTQGWQEATPALTTCDITPTGNRHTCRLRDIRIAGVDSRTTEVQFDDEGLRAVRVAWSLQDYAAVADKLTAAYGTPCSKATVSVRDTQYQTLVNVITTWCFREGAMTLEKYAGNLDTVRLSYSSERASLVPEGQLQTP